MLTTTRTALPTDALSRLRARVDGPVLVEGDPGYPGYPRDAAAPTGSAGRPAVVVVVESVADVVHAVRAAAGLGLRVAVRSTGYGGGRPLDGALLVVTSRLRRVRVDPVHRRAFVAAGNRWSDLLPLAQAHGLAPVLGTNPHLGCVGSTLGGGLGWLARRFGAAADGVLAFDVVTPDGALVRTAERDHPELFWALRGAGGAPFGVVVGMEIALHPVPRLHGGNLWYPAEATPEVAVRWRDGLADAPPELTTSLVQTAYPDRPDVPEPLRGKAFVAVRGAWSGPAEAGAEVLADWRRWRPPVADSWRELPIAEVGGISHEPAGPPPGPVTTEQLDRLPDAVLDVVTEAWQAEHDGGRLLELVEVRHLGGAVRDGAAAAPNDRARRAELSLRIVATTGDPAHRNAVERELARLRDRLGPHVTGATWLDFLRGAELAARTPTAGGPAAWQRLRTLKTALDPDDRFCHGVAVPPFDVPLAGSPVRLPRPRQG